MALIFNILIILYSTKFGVTAQVCVLNRSASQRNNLHRTSSTYCLMHFSGKNIGLLCLPIGNWRRPSVSLLEAVSQSLWSWGRACLKAFCASKYLICVRHDTQALQESINPQEISYCNKGKKQFVQMLSLTTPKGWSSVFFGSLEKHHYVITKQRLPCYHSARMQFNK